MPQGYIDPDSGTWIYDQDDAGLPVRDLLNRLAHSVRDRIAGVLQPAIDDLDAAFADETAATPWADLPLNATYFQNTGLQNIGTAASTPLRYRRVGRRIVVQGTVDTKAAVPNWQVLGTLPVGFRPAQDTPFLYMFDLRSEVQRGVILTDGRLLLSWGPQTVGQDLSIVLAEGSTT